MRRRFIVSRLLVLLASIGAVCTLPAIAQRIDQTGGAHPTGGPAVPLATAKRDGLMPHGDKSKLDALPALGNLTLKNVYSYGASATDQTLTLTNAKGGVLIDGTGVSTVGNLLEIDGLAGTSFAFTRNGAAGINGTLTVTGAAILGPITATSITPAAGAWRDVYVGRGIAATGLTTPSVAYYNFERCASSTLCGDLSWTVSGSGANSQVTTLKGGVVQLTTGATAGSQAGILPISAGTNAFILRGDTEKWYYAARFAVTTTPDAQTWCAVGWLNVAQSRIIDVGVFGGDSTTKYALRVGNSTNPGTRQSALSTVSIDTGFHTFEVYSDAASTTLKFRVDGETPVSLVGSTYGTDASYPWVECNNGTTAAAQTLKLDEALYIAGIN